ncbi:MAG: SDR family NAD(P)-dependent oxidoreductase [Acholeplasmataceae bacterium]|nr:MAG: SDR family NAD(P)-dependent oxidoreductase [Acholeplasmataceae bacterium]
MKWPNELIFMKNSRAKQKQCNTSMAGRLSIITGATSGVGLATAKVLAAAKSNLVLVCRNREKALPIREELMNAYGVDVDIVVSDFSRMSEVRQAAETILNQYQTIDVIINSVGLHSTRKRYNEDGIELCFAVNHLGIFLFTKLLLPRLVAQGHGRIIQVNSEGHRFSGVKLKDINFKKRIYTGLKGYGQSKTAQLLTMQVISEQLKSSHVTINACHPGAVKTAIGSNNGFLYRFFFKHVTSHFLKNPVISGQAIHYLAAAPELEGVSGRFFHLTIDELPAKHAIDPVMARKVYDLSMEMVGLNDE